MSVVVEHPVLNSQNVQITHLKHFHNKFYTELYLSGGYLLWKQQQMWHRKTFPKYKKNKNSSAHDMKNDNSPRKDNVEVWRT